MDQKHSMLYPPIEQEFGSIAQDQRMSAIGLPAEAPPSYDMAMGAPSAPSSQQVSLQEQPSSSSGVIVYPYEPPQHNQPNHETANYTPVPPNITERTATTRAIHLGPHASAVTCPACGERETTRVTYTSNLQTHLCALVLCLVGFCCCACFVPYCMNSCRTGNHYCAKCNTYLGAYKQTIFK